MSKDNLKKNIFRFVDSDLGEHVKKNRKAPMRTICELHRKVYKELSSREDHKYNNILDVLKSTYKQGKFISAKLHEYNAKKFYGDLWDLENDDY